MNLRRTQQGLWTLATIFVISGIAFVLGALWMPYDQPEAGPIPVAPALKTQAGSYTQAPALQQFSGLWNKNLRPPLFDPPPTPSATPAVQESPPIIRPDIRLIGFAVEQDRSLAILTGPDGAVEFKAVGEELHGVTVQAITAAGVTMKFHDDEYLLKFDETTDDLGPQRASKRVDRSPRGVERYR